MAKFNATKGLISSKLNIGLPFTNDYVSVALNGTANSLIKRVSSNATIGAGYSGIQAVSFYYDGTPLNFSYNGYTNTNRYTWAKNSTSTSTELAGHLAAAKASPTTDLSYIVYLYSGYGNSTSNIALTNFLNFMAENGSDIKNEIAADDIAGKNHRLSIVAVFAKVPSSQNVYVLINEAMNYFKGAATPSNEMFYMKLSPSATRYSGATNASENGFGVRVKDVAISGATGGYFLRHLKNTTGTAYSKSTTFQKVGASSIHINLSYTILNKRQSTDPSGVTIEVTIDGNKTTYNTFTSNIKEDVYLPILAKSTTTSNVIVELKIAANTQAYIHNFQIGISKNITGVGNILATGQQHGSTIKSIKDIGSRVMMMTEKGGHTTISGGVFHSYGRVEAIDSLSGDWVTNTTGSTCVVGSQTTPYVTSTSFTKLIDIDTNYKTLLGGIIPSANGTYTITIKSYNASGTLFNGIKEDGAYVNTITYSATFVANRLYAIVIPFFKNAEANPRGYNNGDYDIGTGNCLFTGNGRFAVLHDNTKSVEISASSTGATYSFLKLANRTYTLDDQGRYYGVFSTS